MSTEFEGTNMKANTCVYWWYIIVAFLCLCVGSSTCVCEEFFKMMMQNALLRPLHIEFVCSCKLCLECEVTELRGLFPSYSVEYNEMEEFPRQPELN